MLHDSPLRTRHKAYVDAEAARLGPGEHASQRPGAAVGHKTAVDVEYIPYGVADADGGPTCEIVGSFGDVEREYAAIRREAGAALLDSPHRGTLVVAGDPAQRREFLNRMVTAELKDLAPGMARQAFWLNRKGRIDADLLMIELGDRMAIDLDIHQAAHTVRTLSEFIFAEDIEITDASQQFHHLALHGPRALEALSAACDSAPLRLEPLQATSIAVAGAPLIIARRDQTAAPGLELIMPSHQASNVWDALVAHDSSLARPIGWHAFNIARIEAGTPLFNIDFGATNLPHETGGGVLRERVSFTKGCYLGQEVVARMESRGHSKSTLVGLRVQGDLLPVAGAQVFAREAEGDMGEQVGVVTSSTLSPMLSAAPIAFAMIRSAHARAGSTVIVNAEGEQALATIGPLQFWPPPRVSGAGSAAS